MDPTTGAKTGIANTSEKAGAAIVPSKKIKLNLQNGGPVSMERVESQGNASQTDKDEAVGMMSPESIER